MSIEKPFWHPSIASAFLFDWDGVVAETKLDFTAVRERYYGGRRAMLLEEASTLAPSDKEALMKDLCALEMEGAEKGGYSPGGFKIRSIPAECRNASRIYYSSVEFSEEIMFGL